MLLGGCHMLFGLDHVDPTDGGAPPCAVFMDIKFDDPTPCEPWGMRDGNATMTQGPDRLTIQPILQASYGVCSLNAAVPFTSDGIMVEVEQVLDSGMGDYTVLGVGTEIDLQIMAAAGQLLFTNTVGTANYSDIPDLAYSPTAMRWWRMRRRSATEVIAEYSMDRATWTRLGVHADAHASAYPYVIAGYETARPTGTSKAVYRRLIMCN